MIQLVFAHSGLSFGSNDGMPWPHCKEDFANFKLDTMGSRLVMGAKTFESLPGKLPGRLHIVFCDMSSDRSCPIAKNGDTADMYLDINNLDHYMVKWSKARLRYSVIGGVNLLERSLKYASEVYETVFVSASFNKPVTASLTEKFLEEIQEMFPVCNHKDILVADNMYVYQSVRMKNEI